MAARPKSKSRTRLVESDTEEALRRRGTELLGLILIGLGALAWAVIWTYSPDDPSLFSATDAAPRNALGLVGASIADPLHRALGWAAYGLPVALGVWGLRLLLHRGENRAVSRAIATPVAMFAAAAFAATHVPLDGWPHDYGLGGLLGDAALGAMLSALPLSVAVALPLVSLALGLVFALSTAFALGVTWEETSAFLRFLRMGSIMVYAGLLKLTGRAVISATGGAVAAKNLAVEARARRAEAQAATPRPTPTGAIPRFNPAALEPSEDGVMARITAAVRARGETDAAPRPGRAQPPLTAGDLDVEILEREDIAEPLVARDQPAEPRVRVPSPKPQPKSSKARSEEEPELALSEAEGGDYQSPPLSLLQSPSTIIRHHLSTDALEENARMLENVLDDYGVRGEITSIRPGPVVTMYELEPAAGLKASRVIGLSDDIARSMSALACRVSTIPGRSVIGIELPNELREKVLLREILAAKGFGDSAHALPLALGKDIGGEPVVANLARMPHLLIAGTTGSGKSVAINTMIL
ncbi:DNA translocase FtsK, partial [uncultured Amaricoccus sp.]|uniref:DNA translocase FtsK n=1 Tax=uncultured Amaricoccus sp. TaxID=339341 RepID=UPI0026210964